jgi:hypothetical protein
LSSYQAKKYVRLAQLSGGGHWQSLSILSLPTIILHLFMTNLFSANLGISRLPRLALSLSLLAGPTIAAAQTGPMAIYALGTVTQNYFGIPANSQVLSQLNPANLNNSSALQVPNKLFVIAGVAAGQQLIGLDTRPSTGQLYALGYNATTGVGQLYTLDTDNGAATAVGAPITGLDIQDTNRANTQGLTPNIGFDFNPRVDRIRVVTPNGKNYRLNPNTGGAAIQDGNLAYAAGNTVGHAPYIGTGAYTNSALGVSGTTLNDIDITNTNALLSTQIQPNAGTLNPVAAVTFQTNGNANAFPLNSPTVGLDLDIYYDRTNPNVAARNRGYLIEARYTDPNNRDINNGGAGNQFSSNLWAFDIATGKAVGKNIFGRIPVYLSNIAAMTVMPKTWTGAVSTAWDEPNNWYPVGVPTGPNPNLAIPTTGDDVVIPGPGTVVAMANVTVTNQPVVSDTRRVASVNLSNGATLTLAASGTLTLYGNFVNNDSSVGGTGTVALADSAATLDIGGNALTRFPNLRTGTVGQGGTTTSGAVAIQQSLTVGDVLTIGSDQAFTLLSSSTGTAYVVNNGGTVAGTATVQRYITPTNTGAGYRHYSSPVSGNTVADFATSGFAPVVNSAYNSSATPSTVRPFPNIYTYDQSRLGLTNTTPEFDKGFQSPGATSEALATAAGYTVNIGASAVVDFQGTLNNGDYTRGNLTRGTQATAGWQFLGNPYPSALNYDVVLANSTGIESALFVYKSNGQYTGTYTSYVNGQGANTGTNELPLGQGFFVRTASGQTGTVNFTNAARLATPETALFQRTAADPRPALALTLRNATLANQTRVYFEQGATAAFDAKFDATYLPATHGLDLATDASADALSINGLPALTGPVTVPLRVHAPAAGTYTLAVDELNNLPAGYHAYLRDSSTGTYTDLTTTPSVSLALTPADAPSGRYALLITAASPLSTAPATLAALAAVYPNPAHGTATLILPQALRGTSASTIQLLNTLGQVVLTRTLAPGVAPTVELSLNGVAPGIYTVRASTEAGMVAKRLVVQ